MKYFLLFLLLFLCIVEKWTYNILARGLKCETCNGLDCFKPKIPKRRCGKHYPELPFDIDISPETPNGRIEFGCLDLTFYVGKLHYKVKQCLPVTQGDCICERLKDDFRIKKCSFRDKNGRDRGSNDDICSKWKENDGDDHDVNEELDDDDHNSDEGENEQPQAQQSKTSKATSNQHTSPMKVSTVSTSKLPLHSDNYHAVAQGTTTKMGNTTTNKETTLTTTKASSSMKSKVTTIKNISNSTTDRKQGSKTTTRKISTTTQSTVGFTAFNRTSTTNYHPSSSTVINPSTTYPSEWFKITSYIPVNNTRAAIGTTTLTSRSTAFLPQTTSRGSFSNTDYSSIPSGRKNTSTLVPQTTQQANKSSSYSTTIELAITSQKIPISIASLSPSDSASSSDSVVQLPFQNSNNATKIKTTVGTLSTSSALFTSNSKHKASVSETSDMSSIVSHKFSQAPSSTERSISTPSFLSMTNFKEMTSTSTEKSTLMLINSSSANIMTTANALPEKSFQESLNISLNSTETSILIEYINISTSSHGKHLNTGYINASHSFNETNSSKLFGLWANETRHTTEPSILPGNINSSSSISEKPIQGILDTTQKATTLPLINTSSLAFAANSSESQPTTTEVTYFSLFNRTSQEANSLNTASMHPEIGYQGATYTTEPYTGPNSLNTVNSFSEIVSQEWISVTQKATNLQFLNVTSPFEPNAPVSNRATRQSAPFFQFSSNPQGTSSKSPEINSSGILYLLPVSSPEILNTTAPSLLPVSMIAPSSYPGTESKEALNLTDKINISFSSTPASLFQKISPETQHALSERTSLFTLTPKVKNTVLSDADSSRISGLISQLSSQGPPNKTVATSSSFSETHQETLKANLKATTPEYVNASSSLSEIVSSNAVAINLSILPSEINSVLSTTAPSRNEGGNTNVELYSNSTIKATIKDLSESISTINTTENLLSSFLSKITYQKTSKLSFNNLLETTEEKGSASTDSDIIPPKSSGNKKLLPEVYYSTERLGSKSEILSTSSAPAKTTSQRITKSNTDPMSTNIFLPENVQDTSEMSERTHIGETLNTLLTPNSSETISVMLPVNKSNLPFILPDSSAFSPTTESLSTSSFLLETRSDETHIKTCKTTSIVPKEEAFNTKGVFDENGRSIVTEDELVINLLPEEDSVTQRLEAVSETNLLSKTNSEEVSSDISTKAADVYTDNSIRKDNIGSAKNYENENTSSNAANPSTQGSEKNQPQLYNSYGTSTKAPVSLVSERSFEELAKTSETSTRAIESYAYIILQKSTIPNTIDSSGTTGPLYTGSIDSSFQTATKVVEMNTETTTGKSQTVSIKDPVSGTTSHSFSTTVTQQDPQDLLNTHVNSAKMAEDNKFTETVKTVNKDSSLPERSAEDIHETLDISASTSDVYTDVVISESNTVTINASVNKTSSLNTANIITTDSLEVHSLSVTSAKVMEGLPFTTTRETVSQTASRSEQNTGDINEIASIPANVSKLYTNVVKRSSAIADTSTKVDEYYASNIIQENTIPNINDHMNRTNPLYTSSILIATEKFASPEIDSSSETTTKVAETNIESTIREMQSVSKKDFVSRTSSLDPTRFSTIVTKKDPQEVLNLYGHTTKTTDGNGFFETVQVVGKASYLPERSTEETAPNTSAKTSEAFINAITRGSKTMNINDVANKTSSPNTARITTIDSQEIHNPSVTSAKVIEDLSFITIRETISQTESRSERSSKDVHETVTIPTNVAEMYTDITTRSSATVDTSLKVQESTIPNIKGSKNKTNSFYTSSILIMTGKNVSPEIDSSSETTRIVAETNTEITTRGSQSVSMKDHVSKISSLDATSFSTIVTKRDPQEVFNSYGTTIKTADGKRFSETLQAVSKASYLPEISTEEETPNISANTSEVYIDVTIRGSKTITINENIIQESTIPSINSLYTSSILIPTDEDVSPEIDSSSEPITKVAKTNTETTIREFGTVSMKDYVSRTSSLDVTKFSATVTKKDPQEVFNLYETTTKTADGNEFFATAQEVSKASYLPERSTEEEAPDTSAKTSEAYTNVMTRGSETMGINDVANKPSSLNTARITITDSQEIHNLTITSSKLIEDLSFTTIRETISQTESRSERSSEDVHETAGIPTNVAEMFTGITTRSGATADTSIKVQESSIPNIKGSQDETSSFYTSRILIMTDKNVSPEIDGSSETITVMAETNTETTTRESQTISMKDHISKISSLDATSSSTILTKRDPQEVFNSYGTTAETADGDGFSETVQAVSKASYMPERSTEEETPNTSANTSEVYIDVTIKESKTITINDNIIQESTIPSINSLYTSSILIPTDEDVSPEIDSSSEPITKVAETNTETTIREFGTVNMKDFVSRTSSLDVTKFSATVTGKDPQEVFNLYETTTKTADGNGFFETAQEESKASYLPKRNTEEEAPDTSAKTSEAYTNVMTRGSETMNINDVANKTSSLSTARITITDSQEIHNPSVTSPKLIEDLSFTTIRETISQTESRSEMSSEDVHETVSIPTSVAKMYTDITTRSSATADTSVKVQESSIPNIKGSQNETSSFNTSSILIMTGKNVSPEIDGSSETTRIVAETNTETTTRESQTFSINYPANRTSSHSFLTTVTEMDSLEVFNSHGTSSRMADGTKFSETIEAESKGSLADKNTEDVNETVDTSAKTSDAKIKESKTTTFNDTENKTGLLSTTNVATTNSQEIDNQSAATAKVTEDNSVTTIREAIGQTNYLPERSIEDVHEPVNIPTNAAEIYADSTTRTSATENINNSSNTTSILNTGNILTTNSVNSSQGILTSSLTSEKATEGHSVTTPKEVFSKTYSLSERSSEELSQIVEISTEFAHVSDDSTTKEEGIPSNKDTVNATEKYPQETYSAFKTSKRKPNIIDATVTGQVVSQTSFLPGRSSEEVHETTKVTKAFTDEVTIRESATINIKYKGENYSQKIYQSSVTSAKMTEDYLFTINITSLPERSPAEVSKISENSTKAAEGYTVTTSKNSKLSDVKELEVGLEDTSNISSTRVAESYSASSPKSTTVKPLSTANIAHPIVTTRSIWNATSISTTSSYVSLSSSFDETSLKEVSQATGAGIHLESASSQPKVLLSVITLPVCLIFFMMVYIFKFM